MVTAGAGPILVIAGRGLGQDSHGYISRRSPDRIGRPALAHTAGDLHEQGRPGDASAASRALVQSDVRRIWGGTFHSIANRILRRHAESVGYQPNFTILDSEDAKDLIESSIQGSGHRPEGAPLPESRSRRRHHELRQQPRHVMIRDCLVQNYPHFEPLATQIERVDRIYQARKLERNAMDYDDLLMNWKRLLVEKPEIGEYWADQFEYILVDEYQDTNKIQAEIVDLLAVRHRNVMVVGDDAQSIFGWRGAHFANIYTFKERYPDAQEFRLETNYRSRPEIVMLANASISNNRRQFPKNLHAVGSRRAPSPALVPSSDADQQAAFVAGRILDLRQEGVPLLGDRGALSQPLARAGAAAGAGAERHTLRRSVRACGSSSRRTSKT